MIRDVHYPARVVPDSKRDLKGDHKIQPFLRVGFLVGFLLLSFSHVLQAQDTRAPKLFLTDDMFDFKDVIEGETITHSFTIQNKGNDTLKILQVKPGCGCGTAGYDSAIPPGGEGKITLRVRTSGFRGNKTWEANVSTNDPAWKQFNLIVKANVKALITVSPPHAVIYFRENEIITREVEIRTELPRPLTLTPTQFSLGGTLTYRIEEIEKGKRFKISFENILGQIGNFRGFLKLQTNYPEKPEVVVWISARYTGTQKGS